ncbi:MAG: MFS transporter [Nitrospinae bacterium]|nr:MFS transporter [Nitrospinota bacterium]
MKKRGLTLSLSCAVLLVDLVGYGVIIPLLPIYARELGASEGQIGLLFSSYWMAFLFTLIPFGLVVDRYGMKNMVVTGMFLLTGSSVLYLLSSSLVALTASRILQGISAACNWTAAFPLAVQSTDAAKRGFESSLISLSVGLGTIAGPIIGGQGSLETPFYLCAAASLLLGLLCLFLLPRPEAGKISWEGKFARIIKQSNVQTACLAASLAYLGFGMVEALFPLHMASLHYSRQEIGLLFGIQGVSFVAIQPLVGTWSDRKGRVAPMVSGLLLTAALLPLPFLFRSFVYWALLFALLGIAIAIVFTPSVPLVADGVEADDQGSAYALYNSIISTGFILGPWWGGRMAESHGVALPFYLVAVILGGGALVTLWISRQPGFRTNPKPS